MNEFLLGIFGFILGILSTVITQGFVRRWKLEDVRRKRKIEHLHHIREWMEVYRELLKIKYPQIPELVLANKYFAPNYVEILSESGIKTLKQDNELSLRVYNALREFRDVQNKYDTAERNAKRSLHALDENNNFFTKKASILFWYVGKTTLFYPRGFLREFSTRLKELSHLRYMLFDDFPQKIGSIDWKRFDDIKPSDVGKIIFPKLPWKKYPELPKKEENWDEFLDNYLSVSQWTEDETLIYLYMDSLDRVRWDANEEIEAILRIIEKYETKWLPPE